MENYISKDGKVKVDRNGFIINQVGTSSYLGTAISYDDPTDYIAFFGPNEEERAALGVKSRWFLLGRYKDEARAAEVATDFHKNRKENVKFIISIGSKEEAYGEYVPEGEVKYALIAPPVKKERKAKDKVRKEVKVKVAIRKARRGIGSY